MPVKKKIKINKKKDFEDAWKMIPNFDDDKNFPLVIEDEDSFGNKRRMFMDHNMKLVPIVDNKENMFRNQSLDSLPIISNKPDLSSGSNHKNVNDEMKCSPFVKEKKIEINCSPVVKQTKIKISSSDEKIINSPVKHEEKATKGILKNKIFNVSRNSLDQVGMMISSPIMRSTPGNIHQKKENKKMLLEKLQNCKETPIFAKDVRVNLYKDDSIEYCIKTKDAYKFTEELSKIPSQKDSSNIQFVNSSSDLFSNVSSIQTDEEVVHTFAVPCSMTLKKKVVNKDASLQVIHIEDRKRWLQLAKRRSRLIKRRQGLNDSFWNIYQVEDSLSVIFKLCQIPNYQTFAKVFPPNVRKKIEKLGEGSFGEVFILKDKNYESTVVKFVPVESEMKYNGAPMTKFEDVLSEIVIAKELSDLNLGTLNRSKNFVQLAFTNSVSVVQGKFPSYFQTEWNKANKIKKSENDNPKFFNNKQEWIVLQFNFAGIPLEDYKISNWEEAYSILIQVALSLACAENHLEFEHRDLHLGNVLVLKSEDYVREETYMVNGRSISVPLSGVFATIIDFTFSRINKDNNIVFIDLSKDKDLFLGTGDIQFDVYREMQVHNKNDWCVFNPKTNILWLDFIATKLTEKLNDDVKDSIGRTFFEEFRKSITLFPSADHMINEIFK